MGITLVLLIFAIRECRPEPLQTVQGALEGVPHDGYTSYIGIPYGSVADQNGRFSSAGLAPSWTGVRRKSACSDARCLQLDVHVPDGHGSRAVLVWLSGGSPARLVKKGIIVVQVHYRTGPFGFLCLGNEKVPGNAGVKDVVHALRWVRDNIAAFRGASARVTLGGQGAGAAAVEALLLAPAAAGLFHAAIMHSGSLLAPWAFNYDAELRAMHLSSYFTDETDLDVVTEALVNAKEEDLIYRTRQLDLPYFPFGMCAEKPIEQQEMLLSEAPIDLLTKNKSNNNVPLIIGFNSNEGYIFASNLLRAQALSRVTRDMTFLLPEGLIFYDENEISQIKKQIKDVYFKDNMTFNAILGFHRDAYFLGPVYRSARLHAQARPVYLYQFSHGGAAGVWAAGAVKAGAAHSDELAYLFPEHGTVYEKDDLRVQETMLKLWSDFVKFSDPVHSGGVSWSPLNPLSPRLLDITTDSTSELDFQYARAADLWDDIYDQYYYRRQGAEKL